MKNNFMSEDTIKTKVTYPVLFKRLWPYARKEKSLLFLAVGAVLTGAIVSRAIPSLIGYAVDHGIKQKNYATFTNLAFIFLGLEIVKSVLSFANVYLFQIFGNRMLYHLREDLLRHTQNLPLQFFNKTPTGRIVTRLTNDVAALGDFFSEGIISVFTQFIVIVSIIMALGLISWKLTLISLALAPFFIYASIRLSNQIRLILHDQ